MKHTAGNNCDELDQDQINYSLNENNCMYRVPGIVMADSMADVRHDGGVARSASNEIGAIHLICQLSNMRASINKRHSALLLNANKSSH